MAEREGFDPPPHVVLWRTGGEPERRDGNPDKKSRFLRHAESTTQKEKILTGKFYLPKSGFAFCSDFFNTAWKKAKKMAEREGFDTSEAK